MSGLVSGKTSSEIRRAAVAIMCRSPIPGRVSTRLVPPLTHAQAAGLYGAFLSDIFNRIKSFITAQDTVMLEPIAAYSPDEGLTGVAEVTGSGVELVEQKGENLGQRMSNLFDTLFEKGFSPVVIIGSDSPDLPMEYITEAVELLKTAEPVRRQVVLGPATDGGYYLIALSNACRELFEEVPWSTSKVLDSTLSRAEEAGIEVKLLNDWYDIDTPDDLILLKENRDAPRSAHFAATLGLFTSNSPQK